MAEEDLSFADFIAKIGELGKGEWTTVYSSRDSVDGVAIYSALIKNTLVRRALKDPSWDIRIGDGGPGLESSFRDEKEKTRYVRSSDGGVEPLVLNRSFHDIRPGYWKSLKTSVFISTFMMTSRVASFCVQTITVTSTKRS